MYKLKCKRRLIKLRESMRDIPKMFKHRKVKTVVVLVLIFSILMFFGVFTHLFEEDFETNFHYPYDGDIEPMVQQMRQNKTPNIAPINSYNFLFATPCTHKCLGVEMLRLVYLIKSDPEHFERRNAIRASWGYEKRFSDVEIRTVFLIGFRRPRGLQMMINEESREHGDIVQAYFHDTYYNNTMKTMMGFTWVKQYCPNARYYMFVDDDYYVSTKNVLRFLRNPTAYPHYIQPHPHGRKLEQFDIDLEDDVRLYTGYVFNSSPLRHFSSPWYISLKEYPYDKWPPYVTAGAYVLSREAILDMYYAAYYTKHFRFDDIYVALLAYKSQIRPFHCDRFYFYKAHYNPKLYEFLIASHGFSNSEELLQVWTKARSLGHA